MHDKQKRNKQMHKSKAKILHAGKTLGGAGATPLWTAFSRPNSCGVAPARHAGSMTAFCPRAYTDAINPEGKKEIIPNTERRESQWQY